MRDYRHFLFFSDRIEQNRVFLDAAETHHCVTVLRLTNGDPFLATDGLGTIYDCKFEAIAKHELVGVIIGQSTMPRHACPITVMVGLPRRAPFETLIADLTALGIVRIIPLVCKNCQEQWWAGEWKQLALRLRGKMIASLKQSRYPYLPHLDEPTPLHKALAIAGASGFCILAEPQAVPFSEMIDTVRSRHPPIMGIVGPPGGLDAEESTALRALGALEVSLVPARLTTELAAVVLCSEIIGIRLDGGKPPSATPFDGFAA
jgi:16S rRNA (uracil1498-N3)-methyltransferase